MTPSDIWNVLIKQKNLNLIDFCFYTSSGVIVFVERFGDWNLDESTEVDLFW